MPCIHCLIEGRVQGVFYRASTQQEAIRLQLKGWVKNCPDGKVELVACGDVNHLQEFETWLWQGPEYADVIRVSCQASSCADDEYPDNFVVMA